jgi:hypothetical protein
MSAKSIPDTDWQRIWLSTQQRSWQSLAVVPSDSGIEVDRLAETLVTAGQFHGERPVSLLSARGVRLDDVQRLVSALREMTNNGQRVVISLDAVTENPATIPVLQAASAALLVVRLGHSLLTSAKAAIEIAGRDRVLGSVLVR